VPTQGFSETIAYGILTEHTGGPSSDRRPVRLTTVGTPGDL